MFKLIFVFIYISLCSCSLHFTRVQSRALEESYLKELERYNASTIQLKASCDLRGLGLAHRFHEKADFIIQKPHFLLWSLRSFFESPASMIASNGTYISVYDFYAPSEQRYQKISLKDQEIINFLGFSFHIPTLITIIMAHVPLENATHISFRVHEDLLEYKALLTHNWEVLSIFNTKNKSLVESKFINKKYKLNYYIRYADHEQRDGILFPMLYTIRAQHNSHTLQFELRLTEAQLNGIMAEPKLFYLQPF
jgi:hypothetical protein